MSIANRQNNDTPPDEDVATAFTPAEEALRQAVPLLHGVVRQLTRGKLALSTADANELHAQLQELLLQADALEAGIRIHMPDWQPRPKALKHGVDMTA